jgi:hypothetical protein
MPPDAETAPTLPTAVLTPTSKVEILKVPFMSHFIVKVDSVHVSIGKAWGWPTQEATQDAVDSLPGPK